MIFGRWVYTSISTEGPEGPHVNCLILVLNQIIVYKDKMFSFLHTVAHKPALSGINDSPAVHTGEARWRHPSSMYGTCFSWPPGGTHLLWASLIKCLLEKLLSSMILNHLPNRISLVAMSSHLEEKLCLVCYSWSWLVFDLKVQCRWDP